MTADIFALARIRDVPRNCPCWWTWDNHLFRWMLHRPVVGCPWHQGGK